jgi:tetratricopeptide (TPR) repeat protein
LSKSGNSTQPTVVSVQKVLAGIPLLRRLAILLATWSVAVYANTIYNGYVLDDFLAIVGNRIVTKGVSAVGEIFYTPYLHGFAAYRNGLYRPLPLSMFAIEWQLSGGNPMLSHAINILVYASCVVVLFYFLVEQLGKEKVGVAFIAALLFAAHPIHTEVVANIKSRDELLCFFFGLLALRCFMKYVSATNTRFLFLGMLLYFLSLLSKESSLSFIVLVPFTAFFFWQGPRRAKIVLALCTISVAALFWTIRYSVLESYHAAHNAALSVSENALLATSDFWTREATAVLMLGRYLKLLLIPYPLLCDYSYNTIPFVSFANVWVLISSLVYVAILIALVIRIAKYSRDSYAFGAGFFLITLAPFANLLFLLATTMAERYLFFPSVGFCLVLSLLVHEAFKRFLPMGWQTISRVSIVVMPLLLTYSVLTIARNNDWKDGYTLYTHDLKYAPNAYRLHHYLGTEAMNMAKQESDSTVKREFIAQAIRSLRTADSILPDFDAKAYTTLGVCYMELRQYDSAEAAYKHALRLNDKDTFSRNNLAAVYFREARDRESISLCLQNVALYPDYVRAYSNLGICYIKLGLYDSALQVLSKAQQIEPQNQMIAQYLSIARQYGAGKDSGAARLHR